MMGSFATRLLVLSTLVALAGCTPSGKDHSADQPGTSLASRTLDRAEIPPSQPLVAPRLDDSRAAAPATAASPSLAKQPAGQTLDELLLFYPSRYPDGNWQPKGLRFEVVSFLAADGTHLHGWYCPCENARAVLLYAHGNAGNLSYCARLMKYLQHELRVTALIFDYRGYGRSDGAPTVEGILQDARAARKFLAQQAGVKEAQVVLMGRSLGGAVAVMLAGED